MPLKRRARRGRTRHESLVHEAFDEVRAAEESIWSALTAVGALLTPGGHRSPGRAHRRTTARR